ncbi:MAG: ATP-binding cassette domain-containing protein, partial [Acidobacteriota bacterium]|nr:ATP-binding cassette domain-containing protein [Acidobacteriota bacterium]
IKPDAGHILIDGKTLAEFSRKELFAFRRRIGVSFQDGALFDSLTVFENVAFPIRRHERGLNESQVKDRVQHCLDLVGMPTVGDRWPSQLSGGMRRRVGFARAIALQPEVIFFDEPTTGLDPIMTSILNDVIVSLREQLNTTTVTITHDLTSARTIATRTAMLFQGKVIHEDEGGAFFQTQNPVVRQFIEGKPQGPATEAFFR